MTINHGTATLSATRLQQTLDWIQLQEQEQVPQDLDSPPGSSTKRKHSLSTSQRPSWSKDHMEMKSGPETIDPNSVSGSLMVYHALTECRVEPVFVPPNGRARPSEGKYGGKVEKSMTEFNFM